MKHINKFNIKKIQSNGRNHHGRITVWHRGGGNKKLYRIIDFKRSLFNISARVLKIFYDPNRTAKIALICYKNGILSYILAPKDLKKDDILQSGELAEISIGNSMPIGLIPVGSIIHNIEIKPGKGGQLIRAAGAFAKIIKKEPQGVLTRLISGQLFTLSPFSMATIGVVSGSISKLYKAGQRRWKNRRPIVRGMAMNPIDHPHGGGQGRSKGGNHPRTPWGKLTKGKKTVKKSKR